MELTLLIFGGVVGLCLGFFLGGAFLSMREQASCVLSRARYDADKIIEAANEEARNIIKEAENKTKPLAEYQNKYIIDSREKIKAEIADLNRTIEKKKVFISNAEKSANQIISEAEQNADKIFNSVENNLTRKKEEVSEQIVKVSISNLSFIPYAATFVADLETYKFEDLANKLNWGYDQTRLKKVESLNVLRAEAKAKIEKYKWAEYQLGYLLNLYPALQEVIETDYKDLELDITDITEGDPTRNYLSLEEWQNLTETERNQLALDRYIESRRKSKWQIGRDYELYIGYLYERKGYKIDYFGSYMGLEDLGRDLIAKKDKTSLIIQCKYWSKEKKIHEKHIMQLYGSLIAYKLENPTENVTSVLITNIELSNTAKKFADVLGIKYLENKAIGNFPRIKCNINYTENGTTRIYHLPMDFQYDKTKIEKNGEFMAMTVSEAEANGFRRAYKWHGSYE